MAEVYKYKGFYIFDNRNSYDISDNLHPYENDIDGKRWYISLNNKPIYFSSLKEARKWCKDNYLLGVFHGWTKG